MHNIKSSKEHCGCVNWSPAYLAAVAAGSDVNGCLPKGVADQTHMTCSLYQVVECVGLVGAGSEVQWCVAVLVLDVGAGTRVEQQGHELLMAVPRGVVQACAACGQRV